MAKNEYRLEHFSPSRDAGHPDRQRRGARRRIRDQEGD